MRLQDEGAAAGEEQAAEQQEQPQPDAEFQYMHEDESTQAGDTQVHTCCASNLPAPCRYLMIHFWTLMQQTCTRAQIAVTTPVKTLDAAWHATAGAWCGNGGAGRAAGIWAGPA